jgi:DNA-binding CsgD family transcriptional regulator/tetratricopeptide (TPR) repeat protein
VSQSCPELRVHTADRTFYDDDVSAPVSEPLEFIGRDHVSSEALGALTDPSVRGVVVRGGPASGAAEFGGAVARRIGDPIVVRGDRSTAAIELSALVPLLQPDVGERPPFDVDRLAWVISALLTAAGEAAAPVVVDDAALVDDQSAMALARVSDRGVPLVLVTGRRAKLPAPLAAVATGFSAVELVDLDDASVSELASGILGGSVEPRIIRSLTRLVGGATAALVELIDAAVGAGIFVRSGEVWRQRGELRLPGSTLARLGPVLDPLTPDELDALDLVALAPSVDVEVVERLVGSDVMVALEEHGLVSLVDVGGAASLEVTDRVVGSARLQQMGALRRRHLARRLLDGLDAVAGSAGPDPVTLAAVQLAAGVALDIDDVAVAARAANQRGELPLAIRLCEAIAAGERTPELTILLAELLTDVGRNREADAVLHDLRGCDDQERALIAMTRAVNLGIHLDEVDEAVAILEAALDDVYEGPWAAEMIGLRGVIELMLGRPDEALRRVAPFLDHGSGRGFVEAATAAGPALVVVGRCERAAELAQTSLEERLALGDQALLESAGLHALVRGFGLAESGRFDEADELTAFVLSAASDMAATSGVMWAGVIRGRSMLDQGHYPDAVRLFELAASAALDLNLGLHLAWARGGALLARAQMGDHGASRRALDALDATPKTRLGMMRSEVERARAWGAVVAGDLRTGALRLVEAADRAHDSGEIGMEVLALHDLVRIGRADWFERLASLAGQVEGPLGAARIAHGRAFAADDAEALVEVAAGFESIGTLVFAAEALNQASWIERRRGHVAGAERLRSRVMALRGKRPTAVTPGLASHAGLASLTLREAEVATLVAAGRTSKEVARHLDVSVRTVDNLLQRVYRKLGVAGRADLRDLRAG